MKVSVPVGGDRRLDAEQAVVVVVDEEVEGLAALVGRAGADAGRPGDDACRAESSATVWSPPAVKSGVVDGGDVIQTVTVLLSVMPSFGGT